MASPRHIPAALALVLIVVCGIVLTGCGDDNTQNSAAARASKYEASANRGLAYLDTTYVSPEMRILLDYLQRRFRLDKRFAAELESFHVNRQPPANRIDMQSFLRIVDPHAEVSRIPSANELKPLGSMRHMMIAAMQCDRFDLTPDFEQLLRDNVAAGGYVMTHVSFSLNRMQELECSLPPKTHAALEEDLVRKMTALAGADPDDADASPDLRYEAIAFLYEMGHGDRVKRAWLDRIVAEQSRGGGWKRTSADVTAHDHATVLAVWALLYAAHPKATDVPMVRKAERSAP